LKDDNNSTVCFQYSLQRYICDFVNPIDKIVYLVNGDFWHANPLLYESDNLTKIQKHNIWHDKNRTRYLESKGFIVIILWESEIYWNKELVKNKIRASRKMATPSALHAEDTGIDTQDAHQDWSNKIRKLWFRKKKGRPKKVKIQKICLTCKKTFEVMSHNRQRKYCSQTCCLIGRRKVSRPTKKQLKKLVSEKPFSKIASDFGVSDKTIRKWCDSYGIRVGNRLGFWSKKRKIR